MVNNCDMADIVPIGHFEF